ncbi:CdaR family transcriptional regulator [Amycolatopsis sp. YIM 10]|uniref:PucR family transcriptional regulator n=1 Tax=Amycolatopsis sp. YIM 10 TaxID=2653857 RepID=UPI00129019FA|nr:helix-turn-helix domain-containing protein [Amycolatopsis sp. YIM 10]QFU89209.1 carbohydrate diacid transcriptional activator CdaR [Amycolatopsis sp. YIM 10]
MGNKVGQLVVGGRPLHERLSDELSAYTGLVLEALTARVPAYGLLPAEQLTGDITRVIEQNLRSFTEVLRTRELPGRPELDFLRESAARRAEEGIPIDIVLTAYHIGIEVVWESLTGQVRPAEVGDVMAVNTLALRYLELVAPAVGAGYLDERQAVFDDERSLLSSLLDGTPSAVAGLPPRYVVLAVEIGAHADESADGVDPTVAGRRKLRRLRVELERQFRDPVLSSFTPAGGLALLPATATPDWARLDRIFADASRAAGAAITAGAAAAEPPEVPAAAELAREVLRVARNSGRAPGLYRLDDVLLEYQMSRPGAALDRLSAMLAPLSGHEELVRTLETYLRRGNRRPTATELHVHPNTVDYRLRRITDLTGLDPTRISDVALLRAALAARAAEDGRAGQPPNTGPAVRRG